MMHWGSFLAISSYAWSASTSSSKYYIHELGLQMDWIPSCSDDPAWVRTRRSPASRKLLQLSDRGAQHSYLGIIASHNYLRCCRCSAPRFAGRSNSALPGRTSNQDSRPRNTPIGWATCWSTQTQGGRVVSPPHREWRSSTTRDRIWRWSGSTWMGTLAVCERCRSKSNNICALLQHTFNICCVLAAPLWFFSNRSQNCRSYSKYSTLSQIKLMSLMVGSSGYKWSLKSISFTFYLYLKYNNTHHNFTYYLPTTTNKLVNNVL